MSSLLMECMKTIYKTKFERFFFECRWMQKSFHRNGDWTIVGIHKRYASWQNFEWQFCFFGFNLRVWFFKEPILSKDQQRQQSEEAL